MNNASSGSLSSVPNGRMIDFDKAELRDLPFQGGLYLWVRGGHPGSGYDVKLAPRIYHDRPDYWGIEIAAVNSQSLSGDPSDNETRPDFELSVPLSGITGIRGIAVIGASKVEQIEVSAKA